jgi:cell wall-associated NlpC family hydrolase
LASHRKPRPAGTQGAGIRTPALATAALTSVALLPQTAEAAPATEHGRPTLEEIEKKIDDLYRRAESATEKEAEETAGRQRGRAGVLREEVTRRAGRLGRPRDEPDALPEAAHDYFDPSRVMDRLASRVKSAVERQQATRGQRTAVRAAPNRAADGADGVSVPAPAPAPARAPLPSQRRAAAGPQPQAAAGMRPMATVTARLMAPAEAQPHTPVTARLMAPAEAQPHTPATARMAPAESEHRITTTARMAPAETEHRIPSAVRMAPVEAEHRAPGSAVHRMPAASPVGTRAESPSDPRAAKAAVQKKLATARVLLSQLTAPEKPRTAAVQRSGQREAAAMGAAVSPAAGSSSVTRAEKAVAFARAQIGKPCVWGASGPGSYDCSGLTQAAWKSAGVSLPRSTCDQAGAGSAVPLAEARPGDLIFFHDDLGHVGLCTGDGMMIHAPGPGAYVREESVHHGGDSVVRSVVRPA